LIPAGFGETSDGTLIGVNHQHRHQREAAGENDSVHRRSLYEGGCDEGRLVSPRDIQIATISSSSDSPAKSAGLRVYSGRFAATAVAAMNKSVARRPRAFRPVAATAAYTRP
jgi:hypothetical protein